MKEFWNAIQLAFTAIGGWLGYFLGGCDGLIIALVVFVVVDYATGVMCAVSDKKLSSEVGFKGICRKVLIFLLVGIANVLDMEVLKTGSVLRTTVIFFYLSNEGISLLENAGHLGLPIPENVTAALGGKTDVPSTEVPVPEQVDDPEKTIWLYLMDKIGNAFGVAGLMGNLFAESGLRANNLQNSIEKKLGLSDDNYTLAVDSGAYGNFVKDKAGYGLAQWTFWSRKQELLEFAKSQGKSIGDLQMQLDFLWKELKDSYPAVLTVLQEAEKVKEASDAVLLWYERPADTSDAVQEKRAEYGQEYYDKYAGKHADSGESSGEVIRRYRVRKTWADSKSQKGAYKILDNAKKCADQNPGYKVFDADGKVVYEPKAAEPVMKVPFLVRVSVPDLNIRMGPGVDHPRTGMFTGIGTFTIVEVKEGKGSSEGWGRLKSGAGWIALSLVKRV